MLHRFRTANRHASYDWLRLHRDIRSEYPRAPCHPRRLFLLRGLQVGPKALLSLETKEAFSRGQKETLTLEEY